MSVIENFAELSFEEQQKFAEALIKTINSEKLFYDGTQFEITGIEAVDMDGSLMIEVSHADPIEVEREATWTCDSKEEASSDPGYDADYVNYLIDDAKSAFKILSTVIDGYKVTLDIADVDEDDTIEVEVDSTSNEDGGIGDYEYWGRRGHDSDPYVEVTGTIVKACECALAFFVEADDTTEPEVEEVEEA